jgi:hypothetical protein
MPMRNRAILVKQCPETRGRDWQREFIGLHQLGAIILAMAATVFCASLQCQQLPDAPSKIMDKKFITLTAFNAVGTALDAYTTIDLIGGNNRCVAEGGNPMLYGKNPGAARVTLLMGAEWVGSVAASYELKRHHAKLFGIPLWVVPQAANAGHLRDGIHNVVICR